MENYNDKLKRISSSTNSVERHRENIAEDLKKQVSEQITHCRRFVVWLDESTDAPNMSQLQDFQ